MDVDFTKSFNKQFGKLAGKKQQQARDAVALFLQDVTTPSLRNHGLRGKWLGFALSVREATYAYIIK